MSDQKIIECRLKAGEPFEFAFTVRENGAPYPITGIPAKIQLRDKSQSGRILGEWSDGSPGLIRDNSVSKVFLTIPPSVTNAYTFTEAYLDLLLLLDPVGKRSDLVKIILKRGASR